jgi:hypothetical protein
VINQDYIFTLYGEGVRAVLTYIEHLDQKILDAEARVAHSQQRLGDRLTKELARAHRTSVRKSQQLIREYQLNHQLQKRIRELERELERADQQNVPRDSHNSSLPPSLDPPWKKVRRTRSLRKKTWLRVSGQPGHSGNTLKQVAKPDEVITHAPMTCRRCHKSLKQLRPTGCVRHQDFDIEADEVALIIDSCQAATAVESLDFKPGPFGSRGFGQISYDKQFKVLAATQADNRALQADDGEIKGGLLTYALITEGLIGGKADSGRRDGRITLIEWLNYGSNRVYGLYKAVTSGKPVTDGEGKGLVWLRVGNSKDMNDKELKLT